jgi:hypothetical protein
MRFLNPLFIYGEGSQRQWGEVQWTWFCRLVMGGDQLAITVSIFVGLYVEPAFVAVAEPNATAANGEKSTVSFSSLSSPWRRAAPQQWAKLARIR